MQSSYLMPFDVSHSWRDHVCQAGMQVERVSSTRNIDIEREKSIEGAWEAYSIDSPQVRVVVDLWRNIKTPDGQVQIDIHWCSDAGLPDRAASKKVAIQIQSILFKLGAVSNYAPINI